jgi:DNA-binding response OmpR family regulator
LNSIKLLLIEGTYAHKQTSFGLSLRRHFDVMTATTGKQAVELAEMIRPDIVVLNAATMRTNGERICTAVRRHFPDVPLIHIQREDHPLIDSDYCLADVILTMPFTIRKLMNRIHQFTRREHGEVLKAGGFELNLKNHVLMIGDTEKRLTPKVSALLEILMRHQNQALSREELMLKVWDTNYMGDTRTLDVHVRWLREAIEINPSRPHHLLTVRGFGYKLIIKPHASRKNEK